MFSQIAADLFQRRIYLTLPAFRIPYHELLWTTQQSWLSLNVSSPLRLVGRHTDWSNVIKRDVSHVPVNSDLTERSRDRRKRLCHGEASRTRSSRCSRTCVVSEIDVIIFVGKTWHALRPQKLKRAVHWQCTNPGWEHGIRRTSCLLPVTDRAHMICCRHRYLSQVLGILLLR